MTKDQKHTLLALCLGDGYVQERTNNKTQKLYGSFAVTHSEKQLPYLEWKRDLLTNLMGLIKPPKIYKRVRFRKGKWAFKKESYTHYELKKVHPYFKVLRRFLYRNGRKVIDYDVCKKLNLLGILIWYFDDGTIRVKKNPNTGNTKGVHIYLATHCPKEEAESIQKYFHEFWGIRWNVNKVPHHEYCQLRLNVTEGRKFMRLIKPFKGLVPCMDYKIQEF